MYLAIDFAFSIALSLFFFFLSLFHPKCCDIPYVSFFYHTTKKEKVEGREGHFISLRRYGKSESLFSDRASL